MTPTPRPEPSPTESASPSRRPLGPAGAWLRGLGLLAALLLGADLTRAPESQASARLLLSGIDLYQATLSSRLPAAGVACRFQPTCSRYAESVIRREGALVGSLRAVGRIARCGPWTPEGTVDPP